MNNWRWKGMLAAAIALPALPGVAWADNNDGCSNATLKGQYAFAVTSYTPPGLPNGPPQVVAGIKDFDGKGNFTPVEGVKLDAFGQQKFQATLAELQEERDAVKDLLPATP